MTLNSDVIRIVVTGTVGAGKSTFVQTVNQFGVVETDEIATDATALRKPTTTVALDFSRIALSSNIVLHVYGTPGQSRFDFMWELLIQRAHVYVILVAAHRPEDLPQTREIMTFMATRTSVPMIIGITHTDCSGAMGPTAILAQLGYLDLGHQPPHLIINPHERSSVFAALATAANQIMIRP